MTMCIFNVNFETLEKNTVASSILRKMAAVSWESPETTYPPLHFHHTQNYVFKLHLHGT